MTQPCQVSVRCFIALRELLVTQNTCSTSKSRHLTTFILLGGSFRYRYCSSWDSLNEPFKSPYPADSRYQSSFWELPSLFYFLFPSDCFSKLSVSSTPCSNSLSLYHGFSQIIQPPSQGCWASLWKPKNQRVATACPQSTCMVSSQRR